MQTFYVQTWYLARNPRLRLHHAVLVSALVSRPPHFILKTHSFLLRVQLAGMHMHVCVHFLRFLLLSSKPVCNKTYFLHLIQDLVEFYPEVPSECLLIQLKVCPFTSCYLRQGTRNSSTGITLGLVNIVQSQVTAEKI